MNSSKNKTILTIIVGVPIASIIGTAIGAPAMLDGWISSAIMHSVFLFISLIPILISYVILLLVAKVEKKNTRVILSPAIIFIPLALYTGYLMGDAFEMPGRGESGSEFIPLAIGIIWFYTGLVAGVASFVIGFIELVKAPKSNVAIGTNSNINGPT